MMQVKPSTFLEAGMEKAIEAVKTPFDIPPEKSDAINAVMSYCKEALKWITGGTVVRSMLFLLEMLKVLKTPQAVIEYLTTSWHSVEQDLNEAREYARSRKWKTVSIDETTFDSRMSCFLLAAKTGLPLGSFNQYFSLVPYEKVLTLDMSWRGYLALNKRIHPTLLNIDVIIVYEGDEYSIEHRADGDVYSVKLKDPFQLTKKVEIVDGKEETTKAGKTIDDVVGCFAVMTFKDRPTRIHIRDRQWLLATKKQAKNNNVWGSGFWERMVWKSVLKSVSQPYVVDSAVFKEIDSYDSSTQCLPFDTTQDPQKLTEAKTNSIIDEIKKREQTCESADGFCPPECPATTCDAPVTKPKEEKKPVQEPPDFNDLTNRVSDSRQNTRANLLTPESNERSFDGNDYEPDDGKEPFERNQSLPIDPND